MACVFILISLPVLSCYSLPAPPIPTSACVFVLCFLRYRVLFKLALNSGDLPFLSLPRSWDYRHTSVTSFCVIFLIIFSKSPKLFCQHGATWTEKKSQNNRINLICHVMLSPLWWRWALLMLGIQVSSVPHNPGFSPCLHCSQPCQRLCFQPAQKERTAALSPR
jgi:hypothetical protein